MSEPLRDNRWFYDRIAAAYDLIADRSEHEARETGQAALDVRPGERVLEVGVGTGHSVIAFGQLVLPTGWVCGVDISSGMLSVAKDSVGRAGSANVSLLVADGRALPWRTGVFDAVFISFTLELFSEDDLLKVLIEIRRVLRPPRGRLGVVAMARTEGHESVAERGYVWLHRHFPHIVDCRPIDVRRWLAAAGFRTTFEQPVIMHHMPVDIVVGKPINSADSTPAATR
jgi:demethylmenaquinone methyltransferase/2-methoxy-6-polyprenyl-1,4-benzoquinol methylase